MNAEFLTTAFIQGLIYGGLGFGIYLSLRVFRIPDITTDGSYALGGIITAAGLTSGLPPLMAMLCSFAGGALAGSTSGILHTRLKVNPLLAGILVMTALYSVNLLILGRPNLPLMDIRTFFAEPGTDNSFLSDLISIPVFTLVLTFLLGYVLRTDFGIALRATGNNEEMAASMGISTPAMKITGLALANGLTAISGSVITQYQGFADINMGIGLVVSGLGAVMIGESLAGRFIQRSIYFHLIAILLGGVVFRILIAFALAAGADPAYLRLITAVLVLIILVAGNYRSKIHL